MVDGSKTEDRGKISCFSSSPGCLPGGRPHNAQTSELAKFRHDVRTSPLLRPCSASLRGSSVFP
eukprot:765620-Hanusia_phi.AAC.2